MELPTFLLSFSILIPRTRSNILFASTFFLTRILLHIVLGIAYFHTPEKRPVSYILAAVFPLHANWFIGCIRGFIRRARSSTTTSSSTAASTPVRTRLYRLRTPGRRQLAIEQLYLLRGHSDSIRQQLYLLRGGSLRRIGEYRQRMRDYRRAVVTRLDRQGVFDWVGLNATPTPTRG
ncbi:hypothetical protein VNI00_000199 [Paramarasmius palmivorus]|uniref:Uncharacterized protein n=1 Tax=Paramarasmius palmivorus TaxID=297713 RepID=A0AAW0EC48_9AGAR